MYKVCIIDIPSDSSPFCFLYTISDSAYCGVLYTDHFGHLDIAAIKQDRTANNSRC